MPLSDAQKGELYHRLDNDWPGSLSGAKFRVYVERLQSCEYHEIMDAVDELSAELDRRPTAKQIAERVFGARGGTKREHCRWCDGKQTIPVDVYPIRRDSCPEELRQQGQGILREHEWFRSHFLVHRDVAPQISVAPRSISLWCDRCQGATEAIDTLHGQRWLRHPALALRSFCVPLVGWYSCGPGWDVVIERVIRDEPEAIDYPSVAELPALVGMYRTALARLGANCRAISGNARHSGEHNR